VFVLEEVADKDYMLELSEFSLNSFYNGLRIVLPDWRFLRILLDLRFLLDFRNLFLDSSTLASINVMDISSVREFRGFDWRRSP
jgi:hypothetical protein